MRTISLRSAQPWQFLDEAAQNSEEEEKAAKQAEQLRMKYAAKGTHMSVAKKEKERSRNPTGNVWNLNFFVSNEERRKYDKERTACKKGEQAKRASLDEDSSDESRERAASTNKLVLLLLLEKRASLRSAQFCSPPRRSS